MPEPANKLAASADKLNKMRAVNERYLSHILARHNRFVILCLPLEWNT